MIRVATLGTSSVTRRTVAAAAGVPGLRFTTAFSRDAATAALRGVLEPAGIAVAAQTIEPEARESIVRLFTDARSTASAPAFWWRDNALVPDSPATSTDLHGTPSAAADAPDTDLRHADADAGPDISSLKLRALRAVGGPRLRLFGEVRLEGAAGPPPTKAPRRCLEYCGWLLDHPGATASEMAAALFVTEGTRRSNLSRLRAWLGVSSDGKPYLPDAYINSAHGSRGLATAPICAQSIAAAILGLPDPLSQRIRTALHPNRTIVRAIVQQQNLLENPNIVKCTKK